MILMKMAFQRQKQDLKFRVSFIIMLETFAGATHFIA